MHSEHRKKNWLRDAHLKKGALHAQLGIPEDKKIPVGKLRKAAKSDNSTLARRANLALTMRSFKK